MGISGSYRDNASIFTQFPSDPDSWAAFVGELCEGALAQAAGAVAEIKEAGQAVEAVAGLWNRVDTALIGGKWLLSFLSEVHPEQGVRELAGANFLRVQSYETSLLQDRDLYEALLVTQGELLGEEGSSGTGESEKLAARLFWSTLRDFRRAGVELGDAEREHLHELMQQEAKLEQSFSRTIREDVRRVSLEPGRLGGLPADFVEEHPPNSDGLVEITTDYPDYIPFLRYCDDGAARYDLLSAFLNRGWPGNDSVLRELFAARNEHARLLGFAGWPDYIAENKMLNSSQGVADFIDEISALARVAGVRDRELLLGALRKDRPEVDTLNDADKPYYAERLRRETYGVDAQQVRSYFDFDRVLAGILDVTGRLFGLRYESVTPVTWHEDVVVYDVFYRDSAPHGEVLGRIYLDLFSREGKYKHAACFPLAVGVRGADDMRLALPEAALECNFSRGFMEHSDVVSFFHEFGHLLHVVIGGDQVFSRFSGLATEWDFIEAPSQLLEEWAWDVDVLQSFAVDSYGLPIPRYLVERMNAARDFIKAAGVCTQMYYAAVSYYLHAHDARDITEKTRELRKTYDVFDDIEGTHMHTSFGHLEWYSSVYYTYMWSLVIAKDLFSAFNKEDLLDTATSLRYRDTVLGVGGSRDAADIVSSFLGRPYNFSAFSAWLSADS
jgi:thimet oligopeptidase